MSRRGLAAWPMWWRRGGAIIVAMIRSDQPSKLLLVAIGAGTDTEPGASGIRRYRLARVRDGRHPDVPAAGGLAAPREPSSVQA